MLTLQILDRDQSFFHALDGRPVVLGSSPGADLRLQAPGIAGRHARIEEAEGVARIVALDGVVVHNGEPRPAAELRLGDRVELGSAVLVVGQSVARPAGPDDVLEGAPAREPRRPRRRGRLLPFAVAALVIGGIVAWAVTGGGGITRSPTFADLDRLRQVGSFELARQKVTELEQWAGADAGRQRLVEAAVRQLEAVEAAVAARREAIQAAAGTRTYAEISDELQALERRGRSETERTAARIVRSSLYELLREAEQQRRPAVAGAAPRAVPAAQEERVQEGTVATVRDLDRVLEDVDRLAGLGLFGQAISAVQAASGGAPAGDQPRLQERERLLRGAAGAAMDALVASAREQAQGGGLEAAIASLASARHRFPGSVLGDLDVALAELQERQAAALRAAPRPAVPSTEVVPTEVAAGAGAGDATPPATLAGTAALLEQIRAAEAAGDFAAAGELLRRAAELVSARDPQFAARLQQRAFDQAQLLCLHQSVGELLGEGREFDVPLRSGRIARLQGVDGSALLGRTAEGEVRLTWNELAPEGVAFVAEGGRLTGPALLGAAVLLYRDGRRAEAEALLARAWKADAALQPAIGRVLAGGRGEPVDPGGYTLGKEGFQSAHQLAAEKAAQKLVARLDQALRATDPHVREAYYRDALAQGPLVLGPVIEAFRRLLGREVAQLERSNLRKQVERLESQRQVLDEARSHARDLIFDEQRYFYPYKPPQVSADRYAEYLKVQAEVDRRVDALRAIWRDDRLRMRVPASLQTGLDRLDWIAEMLAGLDALGGDDLAAIEWARALPPGDAVTVQSYCRTLAERRDHELWQHIERYNRTAEKALSAGERELLAITNGYRLMFGHRPLAVHPKIAQAARGHAEEMSKLGYFSHFSPTAGRRTPFDRMKLAGYDFGVSENIASTGSADAAHAAWCRSSGHHRNLLNPAHTELGLGGVGRYWVQNFGHGAGHRDEPGWSVGR